MNETPRKTNQNSDGNHIVELLCEVDSLVRDELEKAFKNKYTPEMQYLLEARLNINKAIEAIYDKISHNYCQ
jgi:ribosome-binding factor A